MNGKLLLFACGLLLCLTAKAETVNVSTAGTLKEKLFELPNSTAITDLTVTGTIDARDFRILRNEMPNLANLDLSGATIDAYSGTAGTYISMGMMGGINEDVQWNYPANSVPPNAFYVQADVSLLGVVNSPEKRPKLKSLKLPSGISAIERSALQKLINLTSSTLDLSGCTQLETIGALAFADGGFTEILLPSTIKTFGESAFRDCKSLTSFTIPAATVTLGNSMLSGCASISEIKFQEPSSITVLSRGFFAGMPKLLEVNIPASITNMDGAFFSNTDAFAGTQINVAEANPNYASSDGMLYNKAKTTLWFCPAGKTAASLLPTTVTIGQQAFVTGKVTSIQIPQSVITISADAFARSQLNEITFESPSSLEIIERRAFSTSSLKEITLPAGVKTIGDEAFGGIASLERANLSAATLPTTMGFSTFFQCTNLASVQLPPNVTGIPARCFSGCAALTAVNIPASVKTIGPSAFDNSGIKTLALPDGLTAINDRAFAGSPLLNLLIPATVTTLAPSAFSQTPTRISVHTDNPAFASLNGVLYNKDETKLLKATSFLSGTFSLPSTVTHIGDNAFENDAQLTSVELPTGLTNVGMYAFLRCEKLSKIIVRGATPADANSLSFNSITGKTILVVPKDPLNPYRSANGWKEFVNIREAGTFYLWEDALYAENVSPNGKYIVGPLASGEGFLWENKGDGDLTHSTLSQGIGKAVNDAGMIAGRFLDSKYKYEREPITSGGVYKNNKWYSLGLGRYGNVADNPEAGSLPRAITADGTVFGLSCEKNNAAKVVPMRWKPNAAGEYGADTLVYRFPEDELPVGQRTQGASFTGVSSDGSIACGWAAYGNGRRRPVVWTSPTNYKLFSPENGGDAMGVSSNGQYVALTIGSYNSGRAALYDVVNDSLIVFGRAGIQTSSSAVSNDGTVIGFRKTTVPSAMYAFIWSDKLGYVEFEEFFDKYAPEMIFPEGFEFNKSAEAALLDSPLGISADGRVISGFRGLDKDSRLAWAFELPTSLDLPNRPGHLTAAVRPSEFRDAVYLSWTAPEETGARSLDYYYIYRNGTYIGQVDANIENSTSYTDENVPEGYYSYSVSAVYDYNPALRIVESGKTEEVQATVADNYDLPFYEGFNLTSFDGAKSSFEADYWEAGAPVGVNQWAIANGLGYNDFLFSSRCAVFHVEPELYKFSIPLTSKPLDATEKDDIFLSFVYRMRTSKDAPAPAGVRDTVYLEVSTDDAGMVWHNVATYVMRNSQSWLPQTFDLSSWVKNSIFKIRFRGVSGDNRNLMEYAIDDLSVIAGGPKTKLEGVKAISRVAGKVELMWQNPAGSYGLTYAQSEPKTEVGDEGKPFIAANLYTASNLKYYKDLKLTSISAYIFGQPNLKVQTKLALAVFVDDVRVVTQAIENFEENAWNTFALNSPVAISGVKKNLYFGIEVLQYDEMLLPLASDLKTAINGAGNLYSEDAGKTWKTMAEEELEGNWNITGNLRTAPADNEYTEDLLGYEIYRDGVRIAVQYDMTYGQNFTDNTTAKAPCYTVKAFHRVGGLTEASEVSCMVVDPNVGVETVAAASEIEVYPNPTTGALYLKGCQSNAPEVTVSGITGEQLQRTTGNSVDLSKYAAGIYLIQVEGKTFKVTKR